MKKFRDDPVFRQFFCLFFFLPVIVSLILGTAAYFTVASLNRETENAELLTLSSTKNEIDLQLSAVEKVSSLLASNEMILEAGKFTEDNGDNSIYFSRVQDILIAQEEALGDTGDCFVYFINSHSILTSVSRYPSANVLSYLSCYLDCGEEILEELKTAGYHLVSTRSGGEKLLYVKLFLDPQKYTVLGKVITVLSPSSIMKQCNMEDWIRDYQFYMINDEDSVGISFSDNGRITLLPENMVEKVGEGNELTEDNTHSSFIRMESSQRAWSYLIASDTRLREDRQKLYILIMALTILLSLAVSVLLGLRFARKMTGPVNRLMAALHLKSGLPYGAAMEAMEHAAGEYREYLAGDRKNRYALEEQNRNLFIRELFYGRIKEARAIRMLSELKLEFPDDGYRAVCFVIDENFYEAENALEDPVDFDIMRFIFRNVVNEVILKNVGDEGRPVAGFIDWQNYLCLCPKHLLPGLEGDLRALHSLFRDTFHIDVRCLASCPGASLSDISECFQQLQELMYYYEFWNESDRYLTYYEEMSEGDDTDLKLYDKNRLLNSLSIGNYSEAREALNSYLDNSFGKSGGGFRMEQFRLYGLIGEIISQLRMSCGDSDEVADILDSFGDFSQMRTYTGLKSGINELFDRLIQAETEKTDPEIPAWLNRVKKYIDENFANPNMNITILASEHNLSPSHFSRTFRRCMKMSVLDYINLLRINQAKEYLRNGKNVYEAAVEVGYTDARTLIRYFKKYEGITPGQYRAAFAR